MKKFAILVGLVLLVQIAHAINHEGINYEEFAQYDPARQELYLEDYFMQLSEFSNTGIPWSDGDINFIDHYFKEGGVDTINLRPDIFSSFMSERGVEIQVVGKVTDYTPEGILVTNGPTTINLIEWRDEYEFEVDKDGKLLFISKGVEYPVTGTVTKSVDGLIQIEEGTIGSSKVRKSQIVFEGEIIRGSAEEFGDFVFFRRTNPKVGEIGYFTFDSQKDTYTLLNPKDFPTVHFAKRPSHGLIKNPTDTIFSC